MDDSEQTSPGSLNNQEDQVLDLLIRWEELFKRRRELSPEFLCMDCPELIPELTERICLLKKSAWIETDGAAALLPGYRFDGYEVLRELGCGGRGVIYLVIDPKLKRPLAVKVLLPEFQYQTDAELRFLEEAQLTAQLQHPGIVPMHAIGKLDDGRPYFAMKVVVGNTLAALLADRLSPTSELPRYLGIFQQVCQAMAYAHSVGVIHRDLKPANIMVGAFGEVQVMDWGLAKVLNGNLVSPKSERFAIIHSVRSGPTGIDSIDGMIIGTPGYMPPEQARGQTEQVNERADVFGLGAILCEILTSQPPFPGENAWALHLAQTAQLDDAFARLDRCGAEAELIDLAKRCLAAAPESRPADGGQVAAAVTGYLNSAAERLRQAELAQAAAQVKAAEERKRRKFTLALACSVAVLVTVRPVVVGNFSFLVIALLKLFFGGFVNPIPDHGHTMQPLLACAAVHAFVHVDVAKAGKSEPSPRICDCVNPDADGFRKLVMEEARKARQAHPVERTRQAAPCSAAVSIRRIAGSTALRNCYPQLLTIPPHFSS
jgi:hypothetical protein